MNILIDPLPQTVNIGGQSWPIHTDYYIGILFELMMQDADVGYEEKMEEALSLYFETVPPDPVAAVEALLWFYRCGAEDDTPVGGQGQGKKPKKAYCFDQDATLIYAAFMAEYSINLTQATGLHWWEFRALFLGLSSECELKKVMGYRTADLKGMSKAQKKTYEKMRKVYALKNNRSVGSAVGLAQRDQAMRDYVARRFQEAGGND